VADMNANIDKVLVEMGVKFKEDGTPIIPENVRGVGGISQWTQLVKSSKAGRMSGLLAPIVTSKVMDRLMQLKAESKTGASPFGPLSEGELELTKNDIAALDVGYDPDILVDGLLRVKKKTNRIQKILEGSMSNKYGYEQVK